MGSILLATFCTFALALVSVLTFSLIGPAVEILTKPRSEEQIAFKQLFGEHIAAALSWMLNASSMSSEQLWQYLPYLIVTAALIRAILALSQWSLWEGMSEKIARELRDNLLARYLNLHPEARRDQNRGIDQEIGAAVGSDVRMVREFLVHFYGGFPRELVQVIFYLVTLFLLEPWLSLIFLLGIGPAAAVVSKLGKKLRKRSQAALGNTSQLFEWIQQRFSGIETIKQYATESLEERRMEGYASRLLQDFLRAARVKARTSPALEMFAAASMVLVLVYALRSISSAEMSSSTLLSFFSVLSMLSQSAAKLGRYYNSNKEGEAALGRLQSLFMLMDQSQAQQLPLNYDARLPVMLRLHKLSYRYPDSKEIALAEFSADFDAGKIYAIAGPSGSGKSTLVKLLLGLWSPQEGSLQYRISERGHLGYLPQAVQLFGGSIAANVSYPQAQFDADRLQEALHRVGLLEFVKALPQGWDTEIGDGGVALSGGQAQRIKIARLLYFRFPLIIIDEGTSALDPEVETFIFKALREMAQDGACVLMVAHRLSALQIADEVFVLKKGRCIFKGEPNELLLNPEWRNYFDNVGE